MYGRVMTVEVGLALVLVSGSVHAQSADGPYIGAIAGSHFESADSVSGRAGTFGVGAGVGITPRFAVEVEAARPTGEFSREYTGTSVSFADRGASPEEVERLAVVERFTHRRKITSTFSAGVAFRPVPAGRWSPRLFAGLTNHHARETSARVPLRFPEGVDPERLAEVQPREERFPRNLGAVTLGGGVAFAAAPHLFVVPDLRFDYGSIGDEINNAFRVSVRVLWVF